MLSYLWLPYMIIPIYAGLERLPNSMLEAASDLGAKSGRTFFSVVVPLLKPADHRRQHLHLLAQPRRLHQRRHRRRHDADASATWCSANFGANNFPFAAALATIPIAVMVVYLFGVRRTGALDNL